MHVEQDARLATHGKNTYRTPAVIRNRPVESAQLRAHVLEDAVGADRTRRILRVEGDEMAQVLKRRIEQHRTHAITRHCRASGAIVGFSPFALSVACAESEACPGLRSGVEATLPLDF